jgi:SAM-dependent methyltransferase
MTREVAHFFDKLAEKYDQSYQRPVDGAEDRLTSKILRRHIDETTFVLDVGCGTGLMLELMGDRRPRFYMGTDISEGMLKVARQRWGTGDNRVRFYKSDMMNMPHYGDEFDVVICVNAVGCYADDFARLAANLRSATRGSCIISMPLPRHESRDVICKGSPGMYHYTLSHMKESLLNVFSSVNITAYSSPIHDRLPDWALRYTGVRVPRWMAYYVIMEAYT